MILFLVVKRIVPPKIWFNYLYISRRLLMAMTRNKALEIIKVLSKKEDKKVKLMIKNHKRKNLFPLYILLKKYENSTEAPNIEFLFEKIYKEKYTREKDYLIRNELRLLSNELSEFIVQETINQQFEKEKLEQTYYFLKGLYDRNETELLPIELKKAIKKATDTEQYHLKAKFLLLQVKLLVSKKGVSLDQYEQLFNDINDGSKHLKMAFLKDLSDYEITRAYIEKILRLLQRNTTPVAPYNEDVLNKETYLELRNSYLHFLQLKVNSYSLSGLEKVKLVETMLPLIEDIKHPDLNKAVEKLYAYIQIGTEYLIQGQFIKSIQAYEQIMDKLDVLDDPVKIASIYNYVSALTKNKQYQTAIAVINNANKYETIGGFPIFRLGLIRSMCYCFLNDIPNAEAALPTEVNKNMQEDYFYHRLLTAIIFYCNKQYELAYNEAKNLVGTIDYNLKTKMELRKLSTFYMKHIDLLIDKQVTPDYTEKTNKLKEEVAAFVAKGLHYNSLPAAFLLQALNNECLTSK